MCLAFRLGAIPLKAFHHFQLRRSAAPAVPPPPTVSRRKSRLAQASIIACTYSIGFEVVPCTPKTGWVSPPWKPASNISPAAVRARESIYKRANLQAQTEKSRDVARARLRVKAGEAAGLRQKVSNLELGVRCKDRANEDLRHQIPVGVRPRQLLASLYRSNQHSLVSDPPRRPVRRT